jgi:hypothetical protein
MTLNNMDSTLHGWAKLDTTAGESAIQNNVGWSIANYTDATARQYLIDTYPWTISGVSFDGGKTIQGNNHANSLNTCIAFVKLEISQLPMSWLKALASQNIHTIVVTLLTSQLPISWLKALALESI